MNFCPDCENYLVAQIQSIESVENPNKLLMYVCKNCKYQQVVDVKEEPGRKCVYQSNYNEKIMKIYYKNLTYLQEDNTLPRVNNITCPNAECPTIKAPGSVPNKVLYINLNESDLTYLYQCCNCKYTWTNK
jgi:DNA-directed RNA polymerase subunit M/transcription elongation factor TFIIS